MFSDIVAICRKFR